MYQIEIQTHTPRHLL